jgi:carbohydrate esterase-like sialic acid-specific acetylesterase
MPMRQLIKKTIRRIMGLQALETAVANLTRELAETKGGVSGTQGQVGEILSHMIVLRHELAAKFADVEGRLKAIEKLQRQPSVPASVDAVKLARKIGALGLRCLAEASMHEEAAALSNWYALASDLVAKHWADDGYATPDPYPDDDFTLDYAVRRHNIFVPGPGNEADVADDALRVPWRELLGDPDCGVFLVLGQSNAANHGERTYAPKHAVYSFDFLRFCCVRANDPLGGASGNGGSIWSRLGDLLVDRGVFRSVLFVPTAVGGSFVTDLVPGGSKHGRTILALSRLTKTFGQLPLPFSAVLWQHGEAEANHTAMSAGTYQAHLRDIVADLRSRGVFAPVFVAAATYCEAGPHAFDNAAQIRDAQLTMTNRSAGFFPGPDIDAIAADGRYDRCHLSEAGLQRCAELWFEVLAPRRSLLLKPACL